MAELGMTPGPRAIEVSGRLSYKMYRVKGVGPDWGIVAAQIATVDDAIGVAALNEYEQLRKATNHLRAAVRHMCNNPFEEERSDAAREASHAVDVALHALNDRIEELLRIEEDRDA